MLRFLKNHGILGLNARSLLYIQPFNRKKAMAFADDKLKTKAFLSARGVPAAKIYARIEDREQLQEFDFDQLPDQCVLKPNFGFGGEGIIVLKGRDKRGRFLKNGKEPMTTQELTEHIEDILDGKFSLGDRRDTAFFEQILIPHPCFAQFRPAGLPDIRVIVFNLVPVMAMLRIPTAESDGKANLHLGGIGLGIDMAKGTTTYAAQYHHMIQTLPHGGPVAGMKIPFWDEILLHCSQIQSITGIGYLAADITIDKDMGPAVLEVNARAGLSVQIANLAPLRARLERVQGLQVGSPEKGVRIGQDLFGKKAQGMDRGKQPPSGKVILGTAEVIAVTGDGESIEAPALIAPDREQTVFTHSLIEQLKGAAEPESEKSYRVKFTLGGKKIQTLAEIGDVDKGYLAVIGRRDLTDFLIDPQKKQKTPRRKSVKTNLHAIDRQLGKIDRQLSLIKCLKPVNIEEERRRIRQDRLYNPVFIYPALPPEIEEASERLKNTVRDGSPLGVLLEKKRKELLHRIAILRSINDASEFTKNSKDLFGAPTDALMKEAESALAEREACDLPPPENALLSAEAAVEQFQEVLSRYSLHEWQVVIRKRLVADATVGGKKVYVRAGARFAPAHVASLIAHEIETHVLTSENGDHQPYLLFRRGFAGALDTQEGLATYNQNRILSPFDERRFNPPRSLLGTAFALEHSFAKTREYLEGELGYDTEKAISAAIMMKRGLRDTAEPGAFTKSVVYFRGLRAIEEFVKKGGDLKRLYIGKVAVEDIDLIEQIPELVPPILIPIFLRDQSSPAQA